MLMATYAKLNWLVGSFTGHYYDLIRVLFLDTSLYTVQIVKSEPSIFKIRANKKLTKLENPRSKVKLKGAELGVTIPDTIH